MPSGMAYLDESGDLGWELSLSYLHGGLADISFAAVKVGLHYRRFGKVVDQLRNLQKRTSESEKTWQNVSWSRPHQAPPQRPKKPDVKQAAKAG
jgi:hypothetical protein